MFACCSRRVAVTNVRVVLFSLLLGGTIFSATSASAKLIAKEGSGETRMTTFDSASETTFALSVRPDFQLSLIHI